MRWPVRFEVEGIISPTDSSLILIHISLHHILPSLTLCLPHPLRRSFPHDRHLTHVSPHSLPPSLPPSLPHPLPPPLPPSPPLALPPRRSACASATAPPPPSWPLPPLSSAGMLLPGGRTRGCTPPTSRERRYPHGCSGLSRATYADACACLCVCVHVRACVFVPVQKLGH